MAVRSYREFDMWKVSMELTESVYRMSAAFPKGEQFNLTSQTRRAAVSIPSNIAEGAGRTGAKEFLHHLSIERGSLMELETQITLCVRLELIRREQALGAWEQCQRVGKMINRLMTSLRRKTRSSTRATDHGPRTTAD